MDVTQSKIIKEVILDYFKFTPFDRILGLTEESFDFENGSLNFSIQDNLTIMGTLHGPAIASALDIEGGILVFQEIVRKMNGKSRQELFKKLNEMVTLELHIAYLQKGAGSRFVVSGQVIRFGKKVAVTRTELQNEDHTIIAVGTATYLLV